MAGINLSSVILFDKWASPVNPNLGKPCDGWDNTIDCFKTTATTDKPSYPLGTKIMVYTDNSWAPGWYTCMYLMYHSCEAGALYDVSKDFSDGFPACSHADGTTAQALIADTTAIPYYVVTRCISGETFGEVDYSRVGSAGAYAIPCWTASSDGTAAYVAGYGDSYGWFWVGGVCPCKDVTLFDASSTGIGCCVSGSFNTRGKGPLYFEVSQALSTGYLTNDISNCIVVAGDISYAPLTIQSIGWSCMTAV